MTFRTIEGGVSTRRGVRELPHDRSDLLWCGGEPTPLFLDSIDRWVDAMVADEHGGGTVQTGWLRQQSQQSPRVFCAGAP